MVNITPSTTSLKQTEVTAAVTKKYVTVEAKAINTSDTITINELSTILGNAFFKKSDGSSVTTTVAGNVITVTSVGLTSVDLVGFVYGS